MSQVSIIDIEGTHPQIPTQFDTDDGFAVPIGNVLEILGIDSSEDNPNGLTTEASGNTVNIVLTNRIQGDAITTDGTTPVTIYSLPLGATPGTYLFSTEIVAYNVTDALAAGYSSKANVRTTGAAATLIGSNIVLEAEETTMSGLLVLGVTGSPNNYEIEVTGLANKTIHYRAVTTYTFIS